MILNKTYAMSTIEDTINLFKIIHPSIPLYWNSNKIYQLSVNKKNVNILYKKRIKFNVKHHKLSEVTSQRTS